MFEQLGELDIGCTNGVDGGRAEVFTSEVMRMGTGGGGIERVAPAVVRTRLFGKLEEA